LSKVHWLQGVHVEAERVGIAQYHPGFFSSLNSTFIIFFATPAALRTATLGPQHLDGDAAQFRRFKMLRIAHGSRILTPLPRGPVADQF
jgi:hypothetical protein